MKYDIRDGDVAESTQARMRIRGIYSLQALSYPASLRKSSSQSASAGGTCIMTSNIGFIPKLALGYLGKVGSDTDDGSRGDGTRTRSLDGPGRTG